MARLFALLFLLAASAFSVCCIETKTSVGSQLADGGPTKFAYNPGLEGLNGTQVGQSSSDRADVQPVTGGISLHGPRLFISYTSSA